MIYDPEYLSRLTTLKGKRKVIVDILKSIKHMNSNNYKILINNLENKKLKEKLKKTNINYFIIYTSNLLHGNGSIISRLKMFKEINIEPNEIGEILFWANPKKFPFPDTSENYDKKYFEQKNKLLKKYKVSDFLELYVIESLNKETFLNDIISEINSITFQNIDKINWIREIIYELDPVSKQKVREKISIHPYLKRALFSKPISPVILDGNNIAFWSIPPSTKNIYNLLETLSKAKDFYFPFYIVFDKNAKYMFKNDGIFKLPNVYFHSPADELIISLAKTKKGKIISKDKFRDWDKNIKKLILEI